LLQRLLSGRLLSDGVVFKLVPVVKRRAHGRPEQLFFYSLMLSAVTELVTMVGHNTGNALDENMADRICHRGGSILRHLRNASAQALNALIRAAAVESGERWMPGGQRKQVRYVCLAVRLPWALHWTRQP
jgi:hypothetical protein